MFHVAMRTVPGARGGNSICVGSTLLVGCAFSGCGDAFFFAFFTGLGAGAPESASESDGSALRFDEDALLAGMSESRCVRLYRRRAGM